MITAATQSRAPLPRPYWTLWTAVVTSNLGDGMLLIALPLLAARLTRDPLSLAFVGFAGSISWTLLALPAGAWADRYDRRWLVVVSNLCRLGVVGLLAAFVYAGRISIAGLIVFGLVLGIGEVIADASQPVLWASLVPGAQLTRAISLTTTGVIIANGLAGNALGAFLFDVEPWLPFGVDAFTFAIAAMLVATLRGSFNAQLDDSLLGAEPRSRSIWAEMGEGLRFLTGQPVLRSLGITIGLIYLGVEAALATIILFVQDRFDLSDAMYGVLSLIGVFGGVVGSLIAEPFINRFGRSASLGAPLVLMAGAVALIGVSQAWWHVAAFSSMASAALSIWSIAQATIVQKITPPHLYGRASTAVLWIGYAATPIGYLLGGFVARVVGIRAPYVVGGASIAVAAGITLLTLTRHRLAASGVDADQAAAIAA